MPEPAEARIYCEDCRFYQPSENSGFCHIFPPRVLYINATEDLLTAWPEVDLADWCGAAKAK
jgi:hypothetical protein